MTTMHDTPLLSSKQCTIFFRVAESETAEASNVSARGVFVFLLPSPVLCRRPTMPIPSHLPTPTLPSWRIYKDSPGRTRDFTKSASSCSRRLLHPAQTPESQSGIDIISDRRRHGWLRCAGDAKVVADPPACILALPAQRCRPHLRLRRRLPSPAPRFRFRRQPLLRQWPHGRKAVEAVAAAPPKSEPVSLTSATFASASQGIFTREVRVCSLVTREAIKDGADAVIAVGGDGTLHELIPLGTGSDFAWTFGWTNDPRVAIDRIVRGFFLDTFFLLCLIKVLYCYVCL
ncbi:uncharacterized protein [Zea mays]|uniref:uncharacterized protein n=1 Tax=Zea mays TaxID=4577 RepID=UPI000C6C5B06|nr:uncharacterized protein LOC103640455 [Zea mays]|eukprot:XP_023156872.1 uncharacterized protein LOC103640455 [Zea mays]